MELQKLIDGLKARKSGADSYESVDDAIRVFEAMRDVDGKKVREGLRCHSDVFNEEPDCEHCEYDNASCGYEIPSDALALIRQQQERIAELEAELGQRDYNASVEMQQYCERYEPTYNPEDGSM